VVWQIKKRQTGESKESEGVDWGWNYALLSHYYGFTPKQVGELTEYQLHEYLSRVKDIAQMGNPYIKFKEEPQKINTATRIDIVEAAGVESYGLW